MRNYFGIGTLFMIMSAVIYTIERALAKVIWVSQVVPVKINGSGEYPTYPEMPGMKDNWYVILFLILGVIFLVMGLEDAKVAEGDLEEETDEEVKA